MQNLETPIIEPRTSDENLIRIDGRRDNYYYLDDYTRLENKEIIPGRLALRFEAEVLRIDNPELWKKYIVLGPRRLAIPYRGESNTNHLQEVLDGPSFDHENDQKESKSHTMWDYSYSKAKKVVEEHGKIDRNAFYDIVDAFVEQERANRNLGAREIPQHIGRFLELARRVVSNDAEKSQSDRGEVKMMLRWIEHNPEEFNIYLLAYDHGLEHFREMIGQDNLDPMYANMQELKDKNLDDPNLYPNLQQLITEDPNLMRYFISGLVQLNKAMIRGEENDAHGDAMKYHLSNADIPAKIIGGIMHGYEEILKRNGKFQHMKLDQFTTAFIEALGDAVANADQFTLPDNVAHINILLDAVRTKHRLNWIVPFPEMTDSFKKKLRKLFGYSIEI